MSNPKPDTMPVNIALEVLRRSRDLHLGRELRLTIRKNNPGGLVAHQTTEVTGIYEGFDWESGQMIIEPARPLTELSPEQVDAIAKSVREGSSWHAVEREKKLRARIAALEAELADIKQGGA